MASFSLASWSCTLVGMLAIPDVARAQDGVLTRVQALAAGVSDGALRHATRPGGPWQRVVPGVYATFSGQLQDVHRLRAATLVGGSRAVVTGDWACWMAGLNYGPQRSDLIWILVPQHSRRGRVGFVRTVRSNRLPASEHWLAVDDPDEIRNRVASSYLGDAGGASLGVPRAPVARAVVDTVVGAIDLPADWHDPVLGLRNVRALMCEAVQRRRASVDSLRQELLVARRRGSAMARRVVEDLNAGCRSAPECELRDLVRTSRVLPEPRWNQPLPGSRGIYPDACWPESRLVVEVDSRAFHGFGNAPERTEQRRARCAALGWRVLPVSPSRLRSDPGGVLREIEAAYMTGRLS